MIHQRRQTTLRAGIVASFAGDGWGIVTLDDGAAVDFHATAIADGSRTIEVGTAVRCRVVPGRRGRREAVDLVI